MSLKIIDPSDSILRQNCLSISSTKLKTQEIQILIEEMLGLVYGKNNKGFKRNMNKAMTVGLSANQVGVSKRISIVDLGIGHKKYNDIHVLINPEIIWKSKSMIERQEGCVNLPNIWGYVKRSKRIKVKSIDRSGNHMEFDLNGWPSILLQHEIDHLNGKLFIDHLEDPKKAHLVKPSEYGVHKKAKRNWDKFIDVSSLIGKII